MADVDALTSDLQDLSTARKRWTSEPVIQRSVSLISLSVSFTRASALHGFGGTNVLKRKKMKGKGGITRSVSETKHGYGGSYVTKKGPSRETVNKLVEEDEVAIGLKYSQLYLKHRVRAESEQGDGTPGRNNFPAIEESSPFGSKEDLRHITHASPTRSASADMERRDSSGEIPAFKQTQYWSGFLRGVYPNSLSVDAMNSVEEGEDNLDTTSDGTAIEQTTVDSADVLLSEDVHPNKNVLASADDSGHFPGENSQESVKTKYSVSSSVQNGHTEEDLVNSVSNAKIIGANSGESDMRSGFFCQSLDSNSNSNVSMESDFFVQSSDVNISENRPSDILADLSDLKQFDMPVNKTSRNAKEVNNMIESFEMVQLSDNPSESDFDKSAQTESHAIIPMNHQDNMGENIDRPRITPSDGQANAGEFDSFNSQDSKHLFGQNVRLTQSENAGEYELESFTKFPDVSQSNERIIDINTSDTILESVVFEETPDHDAKCVPGDDTDIFENNNLFPANGTSERNNVVSNSSENEISESQDQYANFIIPPYLDKKLLDESDNSVGSIHSDSLENLAITEIKNTRNFLAENVSLSGSDDSQGLFDEVEFKEALGASSPRGDSLPNRSVVESVPSFEATREKDDAIAQQNSSSEDITSL